jgi:hypothetical protein
MMPGDKAVVLPKLGWFKKISSNYFVVVIGAKEIKGEQSRISMPSRLQTFPVTSLAGLFMKLALTNSANQLLSHLKPF